MNHDFCGTLPHRIFPATVTGGILRYFKISGTSLRQGCFQCFLLLACSHVHPTGSMLRNLTGLNLRNKVGSMLGKLASDGTKMFAPAQRNMCAVTCSRSNFKRSQYPAAGSRSLLLSREMHFRPVMAVGGQTTENLPEPGKSRANGNLFAMKNLNSVMHLPEREYKVKHLRVYRLNGDT